MTQGTVKDNVRDELNEAGARGSEASWLREARPIENVDLREVSNLHKRSGDRAEIVGRETHAPLNPVAAVSTYRMRVTRRASAKQ